MSSSTACFTASGAGTLGLAMITYARMKNPAKIRDLLRALEGEPLGADGFRTVIAADGGEIPDFLLDYERFLATIKAAAKCRVPETLEGPQIGEYIRSNEIRALREALKETG